MESNGLNSNIIRIKTVQENHNFNYGKESIEKIWSEKQQLFLNGWAGRYGSPMIAHDLVLYKLY